MFTKFFCPKFWKRRGQALVLYALLIPLLFLFVGVGIDLGWYYLNVSRLQNAADAAALAGAKKLVTQDNFNDYYAPALVDPPSNITEYNKVYIWSDENGGGYEQKTLDTDMGKNEARLYANKNLTDPNKVYSDSEIAERTTVFNDWNISQGDSKNYSDVKFSATLYSGLLDYQREETSGESANGLKYYEVKLTEEIGHLFFQGEMFPPMKATVVAYAVIKLHEQDLVTTLSALEKKEVIANWEQQKTFKSYKGNWAHFQGDNNYYSTGNVFRTETINVNKTGGSRKSSSAGENYYTGDKPDSLNLDVRQDFGFTTTNVSGIYGNWSDKRDGIYADWDVGQEVPTGTTITSLSKTRKGWDDNSVAFNMRVHNSINFNDVWDDRNPDDLLPDPLWVRIESDPIWSDKTLLNRSRDQGELNSVRQFIINAKKSNADTAYKEDDDGNKTYYYTQRPYFIFYMGPETYEANSTVRKSQPVVLNLYADWNAVLYMPNSPVVINGNGHKLTGFIIAKEYHRLKTEADYPDTEYSKVTDGYEKTILVKTENLLTLEQIKEEFPEEKYPRGYNSAGDISISEGVDAPKHLIIDGRYVKEPSNTSDDEYIKALKKYKNITNLETETAKITFPRDEDTFGGYVNTATYTVARSDLSDNPQSSNAVKVLVEGETEPQYIERTNLPYVRVYRYASADLYPYVPVCDIRVKTTDAKTYEKAGTSNGVDHPYGYAGVTLADDDHDVYYNNQKIRTELRDFIIDENLDTWKVERNLLDSYQNTYKNNDIVKGSYNDGGKYFMLQSEINKLSNQTQVVAKYRKVITADGDRYIKEDDKNKPYYMQTVPGGASGKNAQGIDIENPIIVDNYGNLQTIPITPQEVFNAKTKIENTALELKAETTITGGDTLYNYWYTYTRKTNADEQPKDVGATSESGYYRRTTIGHRDLDYKIPSLERVYLTSTFNLSADSGYSYFQVEDLARVNYTYLNVDEINKKVKNPETGMWEKSDKWKVEDMFFTTTRAGWMD